MNIARLAVESCQVVKDSCRKEIIEFTDRFCEKYELDYEMKLAVGALILQVLSYLFIKEKIIFKKCLTKKE